MPVLLAAPGTRPLLAAPGRPLLTAPLAGTPSLPTAALAGWWDAATPSGLLAPGGTPLGAFNAPAAAVADRSGAGSALAAWHAGSASAPLATPRLNRTLGGLGLNLIVPPSLPGAGQQLPLMDPDQGLRSASLQLGANAPWTVFLVWSRPNWRQSSAAAGTLLSIAGTPVLAIDNNGGTSLVLFPGAQQTVLSSAMTRRHTHAIVLRNTPGTGIDAWLDGTRVATAQPNPMAAQLAAPLLFLHSGLPNGGAECWFHEAAVWTATVTDIAAITAYQSRWQLGPRKGIQILVTGQSNSGNGLNDGAWHLMAQGIAWHLGALAYGVVGGYGSPPAATCIGGQGIYPVTGTNLPGSFLANPGDGSDPSTWALGADGQAVRTWLQSNTQAADAADIAVILWPWSETDSTRQYTEKPAYEAAARRFLALERAMLNRTAASLPQLWWSGIPFAYGANSPGAVMQREVVAAMAADPAQNVTVALPQTADSLPRDATWNPATGLWSGGDSLHRDAADNRRFGQRAAPLAARAILASQGGDTLAAMPSTVPAAGGPAVVRAWRQSATALVVTVAHDAGTDLIVPATQAALGAGWAVIDGGTAAAPGAVVTATACARLNPTQLLLTLAAPLTGPSASCRLFYPYGTAAIGRGNAVTDNLSQVAKPQGWDIAADLGSAWALDIPVHVPMTPASGLPLSDSAT
jgi:hypothetical protein